MAKINDTTIYVPKTNPKLADYLVGTDSESEVKQTVNFRLSDLKALFGANNILSGSVPPVPATGNDGDFYIDHVSWVLYGPKIAGNWPSGISVVGVNLIDTNSVIIPIEFPEDTDSPAPDEAEVLAVENKYIRVRRFTGEESTKVSFDFSPPHDMDFTKPIWCRLKGISEISGGVDEYNAVVFSVTGKVLPNDLATPTTSFTTSITYIVPQITDPEFFTTVWEDFIITEGSLDNDVHDYSIQIDLKREYFYGSDAHYTESIAISEIEIKYTKR